MTYWKDFPKKKIWVIFMGRVLGNDAAEVSKHVKLLTKFCDQEGLELWFETID